MHLQQGMVLIMMCLTALSGALADAGGDNAPAPADGTLETIRRGVKHREERVASAMGEFLIEVSRSPRPDDTHASPVEKSYMLAMWAFQRDRFREDLVVWRPQAAMSDRVPSAGVSSKSWTGTLVYRYVAPDSLMISHDSSQVGDSFVAPWLRLDSPGENHRGLSYFLDKFGFELAGHEEIDGVTCCIVESHPDPERVLPRGVRFRWWIAPERDFVVMRYEQDVPEPTGKSSAHVVETATDLTQYGEDQPVWFARTRTQVRWTVPTADPSKRRRTRSNRFTILRLDLNPELPESLFELKAPDGVEVHDRTK